ncbi:Hypothetical protein D9617_10g071860 [Elsinoe fawcettii]|nr:Hypothetical protein D9617_10g071860 [Elsinoe fawcettii]
MSQDVLYTLSALFSTTARSENQLLELLHDQVMREASSSVEDDNALANLRYLKVIIDGRLERLQALRFALRSISLQGWPTSEAETVRNSKQRIRYDYEHLEQRASRLTENCTTAIAGLINQLVFAVAQEGLRNSVQVERLTLLATIFIPITFTCTFFGMNFAEFGTGTAPIWIFPVVLGGVALISVLLYYFRSTFAKRQNHLSLVL